MRSGLDELPALIVPDRLFDLVARVHDEGPVLHDGFAQRPAGQQEETRASFTRSHFNLPARGQHAGAVSCELGRPTRGTHAHTALVRTYQ